MKYERKMNAIEMRSLQRMSGVSLTEFPTKKYKITITSEDDEKNIFKQLGHVERTVDKIMVMNIYDVKVMETFIDLQKHKYIGGRLFKQHEDSLGIYGEIKDGGNNKRVVQELQNLAIYFAENRKRIKVCICVYMLVLYICRLYSDTRKTKKSRITLDLSLK